jgi:hypothetical protein
MIPTARERCPLEYCTSTVAGDVFKVTLTRGGTLAESWSCLTSWLILSRSSAMRVVTTCGVGPVASTISAGSEKLLAHWPPVSGSRTDQPS